MTLPSLSRRQLLATGAAVLASHALARAHNGTVHVAIEKLAFLPADIKVKAGETIEWTNRDPFSHTATVKGGWDILIPPGKTITHVATADDSVAYYCRFHPNMKGTITIIA
jgi:plastocyanin